jgi:biopolymer transport protein TolQ
VVSWYYIFHKLFTIKRAQRQTNDFERAFWSRPDLNALYQSAVNARHRTGSLERIFEAGFRDFVKLKNQRIDPSDLVDGARRAMRATYQREMDYLESHLAFLASVGSVSPYVGLLGTVWGIMHSFRGLANVAQATLAAVAPGIAEALVATAIGLFAAIPAVVAYNRYSHDIERLAVRFESFMEEFSNILQRQAPRHREPAEARQETGVRS